MGLQGIGSTDLQQINYKLQRFMIRFLYFRGYYIISGDLPLSSSMAQSQTHQQQQLQRQFPRQQFLQIVTNLLQSLQIVPTESPLSIYESTLLKNGRVVGCDVVAAVQGARQDGEYHRAVGRELEEYRGKVHQFMKKGIACLSMLQYQSIFGSKGIIGSQLAPYTKNLDYISLAKLTKVLDSIQQLVLQKNSKLNTTNLKISNLGQSNIFQQVQFETLPDIRVQFLQEYVNQNILDPGIKKNLTGMLKRLDRKIYDMSQNELIQKQIQNSLRANQQQIDNELYNSYNTIDAKQTENQRLRTRLKQYEEQVLVMNKRYQDDVMNNVQILQEQNQQLNGQMAQLTTKNQQLQQKLQWFKQNYQGLTKQYEQFLQQKQQKQSKDKKQKQQRIFIQRTIKQQLQDAQGKINRLRIENGELKNRNSELVDCYENKLSALEGRIRELEEGRDAYRVGIVHEGGEGIRNSYLDWRRSRISNINQNMTIRGSNISNRSHIPDQDNMKNSDVNKSNNNLKVMQRSSVELFQSIIDQSIKTNGFKKKKQLISLRTASIMTVEDEQSDKEVVEQQRKERSKSNLTDLLTKKQTPTKQKQKQKQKQKPKPKQSPQISKQSQPLAQKPQKLLTSFGQFITPQGNRYPSYMIITQDRFSFLDSKMRHNYSIKFTQLRKLIFCHHNTTWLVLKVKTQQKNEKNQSLTDIVFNAHNRDDVLEFLHKKCSQKLYEYGIKLTFEKEDSIWITNNETETLLSNYNNFYNINRISINNSTFIFQASIKSNSIFNLENDVILIVTQIGILVFEQDGQYRLQRSQKLLYLIPIVQLMDIEPVGEHRLVLKYHTDKKNVWKIKVKSGAMCRRLRSAVEGQRRAGLLRKAELVEKYSVFTDVLNKSHSY